MLPYEFTYDYSKTMWMKMFMAEPDFSTNTSRVKITFEQALELIKTVDLLTQGVPKIVYLVGWQGLGHDDCYLESQKINEYLKRNCDATARDSFLWLYEEAKKYHTVVSVHSNIADEFSACALHDEYVATGSIVKNPDGTPAPIEVFNGRDAYKVSYKQFWESGLFHKYWNTLCETLPIREAGTLHLDNFCIAESFSPRTDVEAQDEARKAILDFIRKGFMDGTYNRVTVVYQKFINIMVQRPQVVDILPIKPEDLLQLAEEAADEEHGDYLLEPSPTELLKSILPLYFANLLTQMVLEGKASEQSARMVAMKSATENAKTLIGELTLEYNKARQAQITNELLEITTAMKAME